MHRPKVNRAQCHTDQATVGRIAASHGHVGTPLDLSVTSLDLVICIERGHRIRLVHTGRSNQCVDLAT